MRHAHWRPIPALGLLLATGVLLAAAPAVSAQAPDSKWQAAIDSTWGPGLPTDEKLQVFDTFWNTVDQQFAGFPGLDIDWAALRVRYRPEIAAGVSRGRFAAIMGYLSLA